VTEQADLSTALAPVIAFSPTALTVKLATLQRAGEIAASYQVTDEATEAQANALLRLLLTEKDAIEEQRTSVTKPINGVLRTINGWFKPLSEVIAIAEANLKKAIGDYVVAQRQLQAASYQSAAAAHALGHHDEARDALAVASSTDTKAPAGTNVREVWKVKRIAVDLLTLDWILPNEAKINKYARDYPIDQDPNGTVPGVIFEREPVVSVRR
jgi:hypothetical protein